MHDQNLTSSALMTERYNAEQRDIDMHTAGGELLVPVNSGQDVYDVIAVTDAALASQARSTGCCATPSPTTANGGSTSSA